MKIIYTLILGLSIWLLLKASGYFLSLAKQNKPTHKYTLRFLPWVEAFVWSAFAFWTLQYLLQNTQIFHILSAALAIVILLALSWFVIKDFISGVVMRSDHALEPGMKIKTENVSGIVSSLGYVSLGIRTDEGVKVSVPYSKLSGQQISVRFDKRRGKNQSLQVLIPQHHGAQNIERVLARKILELPWVIAEEDVSINMTVKEEYYETEISFFSIKEDMLSKTEEIIRSYVKTSFKEA